MTTLQQICGKKIFSPEGICISDQTFRSIYAELYKKFPHSIHKIIPTYIVKEFLVSRPVEETILYFPSLSQLEVLDFTYVTDPIVSKIASICEMMEDWRIVNTGSEVIRECKLITTKEIVLTPDQFIELLAVNFSGTERFPRMSKISVPFDFGSTEDLWSTPDARRIINLADQGFDLTLPLTIISLNHLNKLRSIGFLNHPRIKFSQIQILYPHESTQESNEFLKLTTITERFVFDQAFVIEKFESHTLQSLKVLSSSTLKEIKLPRAVGRIRINEVRIQQLTAPFISDLYATWSKLPHLNFSQLSKLSLTLCDWTIFHSGLAEIYLPNATFVELKDSFKESTSLVIPRATYVNIENMPNLCRIIANKATHLYLGECPHLTCLKVGERLKTFEARNSQIPALQFSHLEHLSLIQCFVSPFESSKTSLSILNTKEIYIWGGFHKLTHLNIPHASRVSLIGLISLNYLFAPNLKSTQFVNCPSLDTFKAPKGVRINREPPSSPPLITKKQIIAAIALTAFIYLFLSYAGSLMQPEDEESLFE